MPPTKKPRVVVDMLTRKKFVRWSSKHPMQSIGYVPSFTPHLTLVLGLVVGGIKDCRMKVAVGRSSDVETSAQTALLDRTSSC